MTRKAALVVGGGIAGMQAAIDLANMGIQVYLVERKPSIGGRMAQLDKTSAVLPTALVIGAGVSGLSAALTLANQGFQVELLEKKDRIGGLLKNIQRIFPSNEPAARLLDPLIKAVRKHKRIRVHLETQLVGINGFIGNFTASVRKKEKNQTVNAGTVIVAVGAEELKPEGSFGYGRFHNVLTQLEFEQRFRNYDGLQRVVMVNCAGARIDDRPYCGRFCCITAMKNAVVIKKANPDAEVTILQRDIMACGTVFEAYYQAALQMGIKFIRYGVDRPPQVGGRKKMARRIKVSNELTGKNIDLAVVSATTEYRTAPREKRVGAGEQIE